MPQPFLRAVDGESIGPRAGSCGTAAFRREPVIVEDIATDQLWEDYRGLALQHDLRACWSTPIFDSQRKVLGTFAMYFRTPGRPEAGHLRLIDISTHLASIAITTDQRVEALRASEERLRLALSGGKVDIWEYNAEANHFRWFGNLGKRFGWPDAANSTLESFVELIQPEDRHNVLAGLRQSIVAGDVEFEFRVVYPDGSLHWFASRGHAEYDMEGAGGLRIRGVGIETTERMQAAEEIKRREIQLIAAQRIARLGSYEWDVQSKTVRRSEELCTIFGFLPGQFPPTYDGYLARVHPEDRTKTKAIIEQSFARGEPFDFEERIVRPDGSIRILHSQGEWSLDDNQRPLKLVGICQDITEQKQVDEQLLRANAALAEELQERTRAEKEIQALTARLIHAQEEERARLARELHDDFSQQIAALSIAASNLKKGLPAENVEVRAQSDRIQQKLVQLAEGIRQLSHNLRPVLLEYSGLGPALQSYCSEFSKLTGMTVSFCAKGSFERLPTPAALSLFRIAQEALQNVLKHAQVDRAQVALEGSDESVNLTISDEGVGIDQSAASLRQGLGLVNIKERARLANGSVKIESSAGYGTIVSVVVPVERTDYTAILP
jgi:PAS domain S-box-containing protein